MSTRTTYESPLGPLTLIADVDGLSGLRFPGRNPVGPPRQQGAPQPGLLENALAQLSQYFECERQEFDLPLDLRGSPAQLAVWAQLRRIPFGMTVSYKKLAHAVGRPDRIRAVAGAVARTPIPIIVPCHRVIGSDGSLTGYGGGLDRKQALLDLERRGAAGLPPEPVWPFRQTAML